MRNGRAATLMFARSNCARGTAPPAAIAAKVRLKFLFPLDSAPQRGLRENLCVSWLPFIRSRARVGFWKLAQLPSAPAGIGYSEPPETQELARAASRGT